MNAAEIWCIRCGAPRVHPRQGRPIVLIVMDPGQGCKRCNGHRFTGDQKFAPPPPPVGEWRLTDFDRRLLKSLRISPYEVKARTL